MAYVDGFEHDVFLSCAPVDDQTASEGERGWVSAFEEHLRVALDRRAGGVGADCSVLSASCRSKPLAPPTSSRRAARRPALDFDTPDPSVIDNAGNLGLPDPSVIDNAENLGGSDSSVIDNAENFGRPDPSVIDNFEILGGSDPSVIDNAGNLGGLDSSVIDNAGSLGRPDSSVIDNARNLVRSDSSVIDNARILGGRVALRAPGLRGLREAPLEVVEQTLSFLELRAPPVAVLLACRLRRGGRLRRTGAGEVLDLVLQRLEVVSEAEQEGEERAQRRRSTSRFPLADAGGGDPDTGLAADLPQGRGLGLVAGTQPQAPHHHRQVA